MVFAKNRLLKEIQHGLLNNAVSIVRLINIEMTHKHTQLFFNKKLLENIGRKI